MLLMVNCQRGETLEKPVLPLTPGFAVSQRAELSVARASSRHRDTRTKPSRAVPSRPMCAIQHFTTANKIQEAASSDDLLRSPAFEPPMFSGSTARRSSSFDDPGMAARSSIARNYSALVHGRDEDTLPKDSDRLLSCQRWISNNWSSLRLRAFTTARMCWYSWGENKSASSRPPSGFEKPDPSIHTTRM